MYNKIKAHEAKPTKTRRVATRFEKTPEWAMMRKDLERGLNLGEALHAVFTPEDREKYGINYARSIPRFLHKFLDKAGLPYKIRAFETKATGAYNVLVTYEAAKKQRRRA